MDIDLESIVAGCRHRKPQAQKAFYDAFAPMMFGVCRRYAGSEEEANDMLQDSFVKVFENIHSLKQPQAAEDWVYQIVVRTALNTLRDNRLQLESVDELPEVEINYDPYGTEYLINLISQLPDNYRTIFNLREVEGYSFQEIGDMLGITEVSVRSLLCRSKQVLKQKIENNHQK